MTNPKWLEWAQRLQAMAQNGLAYCTNPFDIERYHAVRQIAAEILQDYTQVDMHTLENLLDAQTGYATPKLDVRGVVFHQDKILLVKELSDGGWTMPGGWVDINEPPSLAVEREVLEESGYQVRAAKLMALYDRNLHDHPPYLFHIYKLFIHCELLGGEAATSIETGGAEFFPLDALPPLSVQRTTRQEIERMYVHKNNPALPTDFD